MNTFCVLLGMAIIYFIVAIIIIKNKNTGLLTILPPSEGLPTSPISDSLLPQEEDTLPPSHPVNFYLNRIAKLLLESPDEPLKIAHFLDSLTLKDDRIFLLNYLQKNNQKLYDTVSSLSAIDTNDIESFRSYEREMHTPDQRNDNDILPLSPEENLLMGGIPFDFFYEEMLKTGFTDFSEFINHITETYIVKTLSQLQLQHIDEVGSKILTTPTSTRKSFSLKDIRNTFEEGEIVASDIQKELENQNNI